MELLRRGYTVYYYKTNNGLEIDFVVEKNSEIVQLIQVTKSIKDEKTRKRELAPFTKAKEELHLKEVACLVISEDVTQRLEDDIVMINIKEWALLKII